ncbi:MAG: hypothetical protein R2865_11450 [Deinococcales bacterium]
MRQQQAIAITLVLLLGMILISCFVVLSSSLALSAKRLTGDQAVMLKAHYAAESALALGQMRLDEAFKLMSALDVGDLSEAEIDSYIRLFCGVQTLAAKEITTLQNTNKENIGQLCQVQTLANPEIIFIEHIAQEHYLALGIGQDDIESYWQQLFRPREFSWEVDEGRLELHYGFKAKEVRYDGSYHLILESLAITALGQIFSQDGSKLLAERELQLKPAKHWDITLSKPALSRFSYFSNENSSPIDRSRAVFSDGLVMAGPVHINSPNGAWFASEGPREGCGPRFWGQVSMVSSARIWLSSPLCEHWLSPEAMFFGGLRLNSPSIAVASPEKLYQEQVQAVNGGGSSLPTTKLINFCPTCQAQPQVYVRSHGGQSGLYIEGNVDALGLYIQGGQQVIEIHQADTQTRIQGKKSWQLSQYQRGQAILEQKLDDFNGLILVNGAIGQSQLNYGGQVGLFGDGSENADILQPLTISALGDIVIRIV